MLARRIRRAVDKRRARLVYPRFYAITRCLPPLARWLTDMGAPTTYPARTKDPAPVPVAPGAR